MEKTVIDSIIAHSIAIVKYKIFLDQKRKVMLLLSRLPGVLPSEDEFKQTYKTIEEEIQRRIDEHDHTCKRLLPTIIDIVKYGFEDKHHFTSDELLDGYVLLMSKEKLTESSSSDVEKVLMLNDYKHYKKGNMYSFDGFKSLLDIPSAFKSGDITFNYLIFNKTHYV